MKVGDLVVTPSGGDMRSWWWEGKIGIIMKKAIPFRGYTTEGGGSFPCWHILIGDNTVNLREDSLEAIG
jgi:hypothetical protein